MTKELHLSSRGPLNLLALWYAMLYRRIFRPGATLWVRGEDGKWHNADNWTEVYRHKYE